VIENYLHFDMCRHMKTNAKIKAGDILKDLVKKVHIVKNLM